MLKQRLAKLLLPVCLAIGLTGCVYGPYGYYGGAYGYGSPYGYYYGSPYALGPYYGGFYGTGIGFFGFFGPGSYGYYGRSFGGYFGPGFGYGRFGYGGFGYGGYGYRGGFGGRYGGGVRPRRLRVRRWWLPGRRVPPLRRLFRVAARGVFQVRNARCRPEMGGND